MSERICGKCGKTFARPSSYKAHINRKTPCVVEIPKDPPKTMCRWCGKTLGCISNRYRHEKICSVKKNKVKIQQMQEAKNQKEQMAVLIEMMQEMREENQKLRNDVQEIKENKTKGGDTYISLYIVNGNITINNATTPYTGYITHDTVKELLDLYKTLAPLQASAHIYFNSEHPENHSLHLTNNKTKTLKTWRDGIWELKTGGDICTPLYMALDEGYTCITELARRIDEYKGGKILDEIERNRGDAVVINNEIQQLMNIAYKFAKKEKINPDFIDESVKRGRLALKEIEDKLAENADGKQEIEI